MTTRIEVKRKNTENPMSVLRKFTRKVRTAGFLMDLRDRRYFKRKDSTLRKKQSALAKMKKRGEYRQLFKMGKLEETTTHKK